MNLVELGVELDLSYLRPGLVQLHANVALFDEDKMEPVSLIEAVSALDPYSVPINGAHDAMLDAVSPEAHANVYWKSATSPIFELCIGQVKQRLIRFDLIPILLKQIYRDVYALPNRRLSLADIPRLSVQHRLHSAPVMLPIGGYGSENVWHKTFIQISADELHFQLFCG